MAIEAVLKGGGGVWGQLVRFAISGGIVTLLGVGTYWMTATFLDIAPLVANILGYVVAMASGYVMHSRFSFAGHGRRDNLARTTSRFVAVSLVSLALNSFWVWLMTDALGGETWWPTPLMLFVTPLVTFSLNRRWVFGG